MSLKTTHVGSLPRPEVISDILFRQERGEPLNVSDPDKIMQEAVTEVLKRQKEVGITIPSDGEMSKISYATYIGKRISGFSGDSPRNPPADLEAYPSYLKKLAASGGTPAYKRPQCVEALGDYDSTDLEIDLKRMKTAMDQTGYTEGFMNAASPGVIAQFQPSNYHETYEDYLSDLGKAMREENKRIADSGLYLQIDAPDLGLGRHVTYKDLSDADFIKKARLHVEVINQTLEGIPKEKVRLHLCWGNYEGPHHCDIEITKLFPVLFELKVGALLFESSNPRHEHEWEEWAKVKIPEDLILVPGVIDSTSNFIEHPKLVAQRLRRFVDIVGAERVIGGSDCGFSTFAGFGTVDEEITYSKLRSLVEGADMV